MYEQEGMIEDEGMFGFGQQQMIGGRSPNVNMV
jgi:hypothetical protein